MTFFWISPFGPIALLAIGGLLLIAFDRRLSPRRAAWIAVALAGLAWLFWLLLRLGPAPASHQWLWSPPLSLPASLQLHLQGETWLAGLCIILAAFVVMGLPGWRQRPGFTPVRAWTLMLTAQILLVLLAGNWLTLLGLWMGMILLAGLAAGGAAARVWSYGVVGSLFLMAAPIFNGGRSLEGPLANLALNLQAQFLVILAAAITLAAYPFHLWLAPLAGGGEEGTPAPGQQLAFHLLPALAALHLLGSVSLPLLASQAWAPLATVALMGSALAAWAERDERRAWVFIVVNRSTWALLVVGLARAAGPEASIFALLSLGLGALLWVAAGVDRRPARRNWPLWLGAAILYGLPLTPGFIPNLGLASLAGTWVAVPGWLVLLLAQSLFVAALFLHPAPPSPRTPADAGRPAHLAALVVCVTFVVWYALAGPAVSNLVGSSAPTSAIRLTDVTALQWATLILPLVLGLVLARADERWFGAWRTSQRHTAFLAGLDWLAGGADRASHLLRVSLSFVSDLVDGAGQFGWVILVVILAWLLLRG